MKQKVYRPYTLSALLRRLWVFWNHRDDTMSIAVKDWREVEGVFMLAFASDEEYGGIICCEYVAPGTPFPV